MEVKDTLEHTSQQIQNNQDLHQGRVQQQLLKIQTVADDTHTLVNNNMAIQLHLNAISARSLAKLTKKPGDRKLADDAEKHLSEHMLKQAVVDKDVKERRIRAMGEEPPPSATP